jgi:hypothetical protein
VTEAERALVGAADIAAYVETWWRTEQHRRGVRIHERSVRRWIKRARDPLPAKQLGTHAPWIAVPSEVRFWLVRNLVISTGMSEMSEMSDVPGRR